MSIISLRLNEKETRILKEFASFENIGLSTYIKKVLFEKLEEEYELNLFDRLWEEHINSGGKTLTLEEVAKENGFKL